MEREIKELVKVLNLRDDGLEYSVDDFGDKINEIVRLINDHETRVGHATGRV